MLTWAILWFCAKTEAHPQSLAFIAMILDTAILIAFADAIKHH